MKKPISATINVELIRWLDEIIKENSAYRNKSHVIEVALEKLKEQLTQEKEAKKK